MSFIPDKELDELRARADIVQLIGEKIPLKRAGRNFKGLCPFHAEKTPSFMVNPEKQIFHCFGCGEGGNAISFVMKYEGLEFLPAVQRLAERFGVVLSESADGRNAEKVRKSRADKDLYSRINQLACRFFHETLVREDGGRRAREYLEKRGIREPVRLEFLLGFAPADGKSLTRLLVEKKVPLEAAERLGLIRRRSEDNQPPYYDFFRDRLIFSIVSGDGKIIGFSGRALGDDVQPKYLNSTESSVYRKSESLLGLHLARPVIREKDQVILVEGNFDLIRLHQEGVRNVVAPLGTALTEPQVRALARITQNFILLFDGDEAGLRAANRSLELFLPMGIFPRAVLLPDREDPDSFVKVLGIAPLQELISKAPPLLDLRVENILDSAKRDPQGKVRAVREAAALLMKLPGEIEKRLYIQRVADRTGLSEDLLSGEIFSKRGGERGGQRKDSNFSDRTGEKGVRNLPPMERTVLEVLLSGNGNPAVLFQEIGVDDFSDPNLGRVWQLLKEDFERHGGVDGARVLMTNPEEPLRHLLAGLSMAGGHWQEGDAEAGRKAATDCVRQVRTTRIKERLKTLSTEIRKAEMMSDGALLDELLGKKNQLIKEMLSLH